MQFIRRILRYIIPHPSQAHLITDPKQLEQIGHPRRIVVFGNRCVVCDVRIHREKSGKRAGSAA